MTRQMFVILVAVIPSTSLLAQGRPALPNRIETSTNAPQAATQPPPRETRLFELRTYHTTSSKLDALHDRFRNHTIRLMARHGIECVGFWVPRENPGNNLIVLHAYPSAAARTASWERFAIDPEWRKIKAVSEADGKLVNRIDEVILGPTDFCPVVTATNAGENRCFELRIIRGGNPAVAAARCRDHALKLFARHGLTHVGSWTPTGGKMASGVALVSLIACPSAAEREKAIRSFRDDPFWSTVATAADPGWQAMQDGGDCLVLTPTDYSNLK